MSLCIGVISDTHGLLRPEVAGALKGCQHIIHAGDVGSWGVIGGLQEISPVTAVRGNSDWEPWSRGLPEVVDFECVGLRIHLIHDLQYLHLDPRNPSPDVVIHGHTHSPKVDWREGTLFLNPGSAGPPRPGKPIVLARLWVQEGGGIEVERVDLLAE